MSKKKKPKKPSLAETLTKIGVVAGDVIELANRTDSLDRKLERLLAKGDALPKNVPGLQGWLIEITAIGERHILGYYLVGEGGSMYSDALWRRGDDSEHFYCGGTYVRKVGRRVGQVFEWLYPDMINIYSRCQA